jgi:hypothetical protein
MDTIMDSCEDGQSQDPNELRQFRSNSGTEDYHDNELLALRCYNLQLQDQVQNLTRQLEQICSLQEPKKFHLFPRLPPELRRKIWRHALPSPRIMSIDFIQRPHQSIPQFEPNHPPPVLLQVCHESREVALENYELAFEAQGPCGSSQQAPTGGTPNPSPRGFYFDFRTDTLCFTRETMPLRIVLFLEDMSPSEVARVRYLAVGTELPKDVMKYITQFPGLEVFSLILSDPRVVAPRGRFRLVEVDHRSIWVMGAYWNHELTSWGRMEAMIRGAFEDERLIRGQEGCRVPRVEFVYTVSGEEGCCRDCPGHEEVFNGMGLGEGHKEH